MTNQEMFDKAVRGVIDQGGPSIKFIKGHPICVYRSGDGKKCAIGQLIPDDMYDPEMERAPLCSVFEGAGFTQLDGVDFDFVAALQRVHDISARDVYSPFMPNFIERAKNFAADWGLDDGVLNGHDG